MEPTHDAGYILWMPGHHASSSLPVISSYSDTKLMSARNFYGETAV